MRTNAVHNTRHLRICGLERFLSVGSKLYASGTLEFDDRLEFDTLHPPSPLNENQDLFFKLGLIPLFSDAPEHSLKTLLQNAQEVSPPPGTQIVERATPADTLHLILQGYVGSYAEDGADAQCLVDLMGTNSFIGLPEIFLSRPHQYAYRTFGDTQILCIPTQDLLSALQTDWNLLKSMMGGISQRLHGLVNQINSLKTQKAIQRLAAHFLELAEHNGGALEFTLPYDKKDLAAHLGLVPVSLSRALKKLKNHGVDVQGRSITIHDPQSLMSLVEGPMSLI